MHRSRKLGIRLSTAAAIVGGLLALPVSAEADSCNVSVTLASGQQLSFAVSVPAGTPLSAINLPVTGTAVSVTESCTPDTDATATSASSTDTPSTNTPSTDTPSTVTTATETTTDSSGTTVPGTGTLSATTPLSTATLATGTGTATVSAGTTATGPSSTTATATVSLATPLAESSEAPSTSKVANRSSTSTTVDTTPVTKLTAADGAPADTNPTYSFALPGAAAVGVPNFFIDAFEIPPFLLPIYQAAGIEYNVPWQVLAAINWIETDYGRDLSVSSAGAVGWMQFLPSTFAKWGVDATGSGYADPYNPTDAIFTAARYLSAAGASKSLSTAIFAYNHASWYVQSVLLRAQLIGGMPADLISSLTNLVEGHFPVAATATYADDSVIKQAGKKIKSGNAAIPVESSAAKGTNIYAKVGAPVIAVNDGKVVAIGHTAQLGRYVKLQDDEGNTYTYSHLGTIPKLYPVPKPVHTTKRELAQEISGTGATATSNVTTTGTSTSPATAASAGLQPDAKVKITSTKVPVAAGSKARPKQKLKSLLTVTLKRGNAAKASATSTTTTSATAGTATAGTATTSTSTRTSTTPTPSVGTAAKERLFANPTRPASFAAGGEQQLDSEGAAITNFQSYFSDVLHLAKDQYTLAPLTKGSIVVAGTVLGRIGAGTDGQAPHVYFQIQPASSKSTYIDPKPVLDGWKLLEATSIYRASGLNPFLSSSKQATIGQILLESKSQLQEEVLKDPRISIYQCGRRDIQSGAIDRRILATMEFLAASGLDPTISGLKCGAGTSGIDAAGQTGASMDISAINNIAIAGHDNTGSIADIAIRRLLTLQGAMAPADIISGLSYKGQSNTLALPDHKNRIQVTFTPQFGANKKLTKEVSSILKPDQWIQLINHIGEIPEPSVPTARSSYAVKTKTQ